MKAHNPGLFDKSMGGHVRFGDTADHTVMVETVRELQIPSIVLRNDRDFIKTFDLLEDCLNSIAVVKRIDTKNLTLVKKIKSKDAPIINKLDLYFGVYNGSVRTVDREAKGILLYSLDDLRESVKTAPSLLRKTLRCLSKDIIIKSFNLRTHQGGMKNAYIFHGTDGYPEENWFPWLKKELEKLGYRVVVLQFPTPKNQTPASRFKIFDEYKNQLNNETVLAGHNLGGSFLSRVLEILKSPIRASYLIAIPIGIPPRVDWSGDQLFTGHSFDWQKMKEICRKFYVLYSMNDPYVGPENSRQLAQNLKAKLILKSNAGHYNTKAGFIRYYEPLNIIKSELNL